MKLIGMMQGMVALAMLWSTGCATVVSVEPRSEIIYKGTVPGSEKTVVRDARLETKRTGCRLTLTLKAQVDRHWQERQIKRTWDEAKIRRIESYWVDGRQPNAVGYYRSKKNGKVVAEKSQFRRTVYDTEVRNEREKKVDVRDRTAPADQSLTVKIQAADGRTLAEASLRDGEDMSVDLCGLGYPFEEALGLSAVVEPIVATGQPVHQLALQFDPKDLQRIFLASDPALEAKQTPRLSWGGKPSVSGSEGASGPWEGGDVVRIKAVLENATRGGHAYDLSVSEVNREGEVVPVSLGLRYVAPGSSHEVTYPVTLPYAHQAGTREVSLVAQDALGHRSPLLRVSIPFQATSSRPALELQSASFRNAPDGALKLIVHLRNSGQRRAEDVVIAIKRAEGLTLASRTARVAGIAPAGNAEAEFVIKDLSPSSGAVVVEAEASERLGISTNQQSWRMSFAPGM